MRSIAHVVKTSRICARKTVPMMCANKFCTNINHSMKDINAKDPYAKKAQTRAEISSSFTSKISNFFQSLGDRGVGKQFTIADEVLIWGNELNQSHNVSNSNSKFEADHEDMGLISRWQTFSDAEYGGDSNCKVSFKYPKISNEVVTPILAFEGMVNFTGMLLKQV